MKNTDLVLIRDLKEVELLYVENDKALSDSDRMYMETYLTGMQKGWEDLDNFKIKYIFNAFSNPETFKELEKADNILLFTTFTGNSSYMLDNFIKMCQVKNLKNKRIFNLFHRDLLSSHIKYVMDDIISLDKENNISLYTLPRGMFDCLVKINGEFN